MTRGFERLLSSLAQRLLGGSAAAVVAPGPPAGAAAASACLPAPWPGEVVGKPHRCPGAPHLWTSKENGILSPCWEQGFETKGIWFDKVTSALILGKVSRNHVFYRIFENKKSETNVSFSVHHLSCTGINHYKISGTLYYICRQMQSVHMKLHFWGRGS